MMQIYYDSLQEGVWFKGLNNTLSDAELIPINDIQPGTLVAKALEYDRPDIILADNGHPILVIERTVEVPTGHNVGQRFARLAAAAESKIPLVYFGPFMARKHGGATEGPRYMNLRLFYALDALADINSTAVTAINWPVDEDFELIKTPDKDAGMKRYLDLFLGFYREGGMKGINKKVLSSQFHAELAQEREEFIQRRVRSPKEYDVPPPSVKIVEKNEFIKDFKIDPNLFAKFQEIVLYNVGMTYVRSDPYTGTGMLYLYLYVLEEKAKKRALVLNFPHITQAMWDKASQNGRRKDVRLYKHIADLILLKDGIWRREQSSPRSPEPIR